MHFAPQTSTPAPLSLRPAPSPSTRPNQPLPPPSDPLSPEASPPNRPENRYERLLQNSAPDTQNFSPLLARISSQIRHSIPTHSPHQTAIRDVAAGVAAPVLISFLLWVLHRSRSLGIQKLYFPSRDGQILVALARILARKTNNPIELRYLLGSRRAWHAPALSAIPDEKKLAWILEGHEQLSIASWCSRLLITPHDIAPALHQCGFASDADWTRDLSPEHRSRLRTLIQHPIVLPLILQRAASARSLARDYFRQEQLFHGKWAAVDVGWRGHQHDSLVELLGLPVPPPCFFLGLFENASKGNNDRFGWLFDHRTFPSQRLDWHVPPILEIFCAADHGSVIGYERKIDSVTPLLREPHNLPALNWGLPLLHQTLIAFAEAIPSSSLRSPPIDTLFQLAWKLLAEFVSRPTAPEVEAWGSYLFDDPNSDELLPLASPYKASQLFELFMPHGIQRPNHLAWPAGCLQKSPTWIRTVITLAQSVRNSAIPVYKWSKNSLRKKKNPPYRIANPPVGPATSTR